MDEPMRTDTDRHEQDTPPVVVAQFRITAGPDLVITPREAVVFLSMSAAEYAASPCEEEDCEICYEFVTTWKSLYQSLDAADRFSVELALERYNVRAPAYPAWRS